MLSKVKIRMKGFNNLLFIFVLFTLLMVSKSVDTITPTRALTQGSTIISDKGRYEMGFFCPENSVNWYLGIWYYNIVPRVVVWVANRETPLNDTSGILSVTKQGNLTLAVSGSTNRIIWSTTYTGSSKNPIAQLLDAGNLVVRDASDADPKNFLWQSFDHPGDTLLPGMKWGKNFLTGFDRVLQSWKSSSDPSRGDFTFLFDTNGYPQPFLMNGSVERFRFGPWNGLWFSQSPGLKPNPIYRYYYVFNQEEVYYGFQLINESVYSRLVVNPNGILQRLTWNYRIQDWTTFFRVPGDNCDYYGFCQAYGICNIDNSPVSCGCPNKFMPKHQKNWGMADWSDGCIRRTPLDCQNGDGFIKYSGIKLPDTRHSWYDTKMSLKECEQVCLKNCSCMAYANLDIRNGGSGCLLWFGDLTDMREMSENGQDIYIRMASSEIGSNSMKGKKLAVLAGPILLGILAVLFLAFYACKKQQQQPQQPPLLMEGVAMKNPEPCCSSTTQNEDLELPLFDYERIAIATNNFLDSSKLGEGGFGPVYKGILEDEQEVAVKRLSEHSAQGLDEFKNEVIFIAKLQHRNLVKLLGCCIQGEEKMLIYEYMPNKSLDCFIFDKQQCTLLDWPKRFKIINGIARGLLYLHQDSRLRIIHRDLKASNILLDIEMNPKISDFGIARSFDGNETQGNTGRVVGTYGYMSPEYAVDGLFSVKSDVYSFGVLLLEIVSGQKNRGFVHPEHHHNLLGHAWLLFREGRHLELMDEHLVEYPSEVLRIIQVGLLCVQQNPEDRPSMSSVVLMLGGEGGLPHPKEPGFFAERNLFFDPEDSSSRCARSPCNGLSITLLEPR